MQIRILACHSASGPPSDPRDLFAAHLPDVSQLILDFGPPPAPVFDNFVPGRNGECLAALRALPEHLHQGITPPNRFVYVWGPSGSGKTHLAAALDACAAPRLAVVDDCDRLPPAAQQALFHRFDTIAQSPSEALVAFGNAPPARLGLMPELASRLAWGIVFALEPLGDADLAGAMQRAAHERGLSLGPEVPAYLLTHTRRDIASLKTIIASLDRLSLQQKRPVTLPLLRALLSGAAADPAAMLPDRMPR